jgi:hypothetical protein
MQKRKSVVPSPLKPAVPQTIDEIMFSTASEAIRQYGVASLMLERCRAPSFDLILARSPRLRR